MVSGDGLKRRITKIEQEAGTSQRPRLIVKAWGLWIQPGSNAEDISKGCLTAVKCRKTECLADACPDYQAPKEDS